MKYFNNIITLDELKKQFRALSIKLHPDRGGNAEEFKAMMAEYQDIMHNFDQAKERAEAEAEARRQAEEEAKAAAKRKAEEEEAARKAAEAMRPVVAKWSAILERVQPQACYTRPDAAYLAALKRNIKKVWATYFPGVAVSVNINNKHWSERAEVRWTDGPTLEEVEAVEELRHFIATEYVCDPYSDYGDDVEITYNKAWREAFGEIQAQRFTLTREFSDLGKAEVIGKIREILPQFAGVDAQSGAAPMSSADCATLARFFYDYRSRKYSELSEDERAAAFECEHMESQRYCQCLESNNYYGGVTPLCCVVDLFRTYYHISAATTKAANEAAAAPKFVPKHSSIYKAVVKALGGNFFAASNDCQEWSQRKPITPAEAAELLAQGVHVDLVKPWRSSRDHSLNMSAVFAGGYKTQEKRAAKFAAVGFTVQITGVYQVVRFVSVSAEVLVELRKDAASVAQQLAAWEAAQREGKTTRKGHTEQTADTANDEAPAEGLELVEIAGGVAVVGDSRTTFRNRKQIKAHGAIWNKEAQQWQATEPEAVARLRAWFGVAEQATEQPEQPEPTAEDAERVTRIAAILSDVIDIFEHIATQKTAREMAIKQAEAEQLRADIAKMSEQVAKMTEALRTMSARLATLEQEADNGTTSDTEPQPEEQAQERLEMGEGKPDTLGMLRAAAEDAERLTAANDHTAALLARLYVLTAVGLRVRPLIARAKAIEAAQQRGHLTPDEVSYRQRISREAERRAALLLTPEEFRALYGLDPKTDSKAA